MSVPRSQTEKWFVDHADLAALVLVLGGLPARLWVSSGTFLNPDEALHFRLANQPSLAAVYRVSLTEPHPPGWQIENLNTLTGAPSPPSGGSAVIVGFIE